MDKDKFLNKIAALHGACSISYKNNGSVEQVFARHGNWMRLVGLRKDGRYMLL